MTKKTFKDSDILNAMITKLDEDSIVYGANGHYGIGAYYDIELKGEGMPNVDLDKVSGITTAQDYMTNNNELDENLQKADWIKEF